MKKNKPQRRKDAEKKGKGEKGKRISRLMMNYILMYHGHTPAIINKLDRQDYIDSLKKSREIENTGPLRGFLYAQQIKHFDKQIEAQRSGGKDIFLSMLV